MVRAVVRELRRRADPNKAAFFPRFFKAGKGEYAEGDRFLGVDVPQMRAVAKAFGDATLRDIERLLRDPFHECRFVGLLMLTERYRRGDDMAKQKAVDFYLAHIDRVNNWDLVDLTAYSILGDWLVARNRSVLYRLAKKHHLWSQRIAIVSTYAFIRKGDLSDTFALAKLFLAHEHDLMHKATGWMLREAGKRDKKALSAFLKRHVRAMPRTMLRYAIEKYSASERKRWLAL